MVAYDLSKQLTTAARQETPRPEGGSSSHRTVIKIPPFLKTAAVGTGRQENTSITALLQKGNRNKADP